jgi:catechol 2,3-dioxygenase-like lactoylglutathione lyase family enzyme
MENRTSVYVETERQSPRRISHLAIRTLQVEKVREFYVEVFGLTATDSGLTDGRVSLLFMPWDIRDYHGSGIVRPGPDHIGFAVESIEAVKERLASVGDNNPHLRPLPLGAGSEGAARLKLFAKCPCGSHHLADPDGILIDLAEQ